MRDSGTLGADMQGAVCGALSRAERATDAMVHPDGDIALFNDSWLGEAPHAADLVPGLDLEPEKAVRHELPQTGYVRLAQGGDSLVMDFGACGPDDNPGHAHADFLSIELSVGGRKAIVDAGVPTYSAGLLRDRSRSAAHHNGPSFEGLEPLEFWSSFRVGHRGYGHKLPISADPFLFAAWQSGYLPQKAIVARALEFVPGSGVLIADVWLGAEEHAAASNFTLADTWTLSGETAFQYGGGASGPALRFVALDGNIGDKGRTSYWERFGVERSGTRLALTPVRHDECRSAGVWIGWGAEIPDVRGRCAALQQRLRTAIQSLPEVRHGVRGRR